MQSISRATIKGLPAFLSISMPARILLIWAAFGLICIHARGQSPYPTPAIPIPLQYAYTADQIKELEHKAYRGDGQAALDLYARAALVADDRDEQLHWLTVGVLNGSPIALMNYSIFLKETKIDENLYRLRKNFILSAWTRFSGKWSAEVKRTVREHYQDRNITLK